MNWTIHPDGYHYSHVPGYRFEVGEYHKDSWLLKYWTAKCSGSIWVWCESRDEAFDVAEKLTLMSDRPTIT
jgi:hypothetical protein